jgi:membrane protease YdiL (CAAX protease family)
MKNNWKAIFVFCMLFIVYHSAEYMIVFKNNPSYFFVLQGLFFILAWLLGHWYSQNGLAAWGLSFNRKKIRLMIIGFAMGIVLYGIPFAVSLFLGVEEIIKIPHLKTIIISSLPFAIGVFFSSFSEDILTRGILYAKFHATSKPYLLAIGSALIYLLNHIYRLSDGPVSWIYLFMLGLALVIPLINTKNLWLTGVMHWSGNVFFYVTHSVIQTESVEGKISPNYIFAICMIFIIPFIYFITKKKHLQSDFKSPN